MQFLQDELFTTPSWIISNDIFSRIGYTGQVEKIRSQQERILNQLLDFDRFGRMIENSVINGDNAYSILEMTSELRAGIWSELKTGTSPDTYRRNLQRAHVERLCWMLRQNGTTDAQGNPLPFFSRPSSVNVLQSDILPVVKAELKQLLADVKLALPKAKDDMTKAHLQDVIERIEKALKPE